MSTRGIRRAFGVCYQTLMVWVGGKVAALPTFAETLLPSQNGDGLERDELWSFVGCKATRWPPDTPSLLPSQRAASATWMPSNS